MLDLPRKRALNRPKAFEGEGCLQVLNHSIDSYNKLSMTPVAGHTALCLPKFGSLTRDRTGLLYWRGQTKVDGGLTPCIIVGVIKGMSAASVGSRIQIVMTISHRHRFAPEKACPECYGKRSGGRDAAFEMV
jgi:hypothetical protein